MIENVENPSFSPRDFRRAGKKPGISVIIRLHNEAEYLEPALQSIQTFFDEYVIVFNTCTDRTPEIVEDFARENPGRVRAYHYVPEVFPQGSREHRRLPPDRVGSLVHYSNFALSRTSHLIWTKWDGDMVAAPEAVGGVTDRLRSLKSGTPARWLSPWKLGCWWFSGVNLWDEGGRIFVMKNRSVSGRSKDHLFWPSGRRHIFRHHPRVEYLRTIWLFPRFAGFSFFHLKGMKKERGRSVYQFDRNPDSPFRAPVEQYWTDPELITFEEYLEAVPAARSLPPPESLGIRPVRD